MHEIVSILDTSNGRCYSVIPTSEMIRLGIRRVEFGFVSFIKLYFHPPGILQYDAVKHTEITNSKGKRILYKVQYELSEMLNDKINHAMRILNTGKIIALKVNLRSC